MLLIRILITTAVVVFGWCFALVFLDRLRGGGNPDNAAALDGSRSVTWWTCLETLGALLAYQLQFRVLRDLVSNGVLVGDPLFSNLFGTANASNPAVMAALLVTLSVVGAMAAAHGAITLIGIIAMGAGGELSDRGAIAGAVEQGLLNALYLVMGVYLVVFDARVFSQQWMLDAESRKHSASTFESVAFYAYLAFLPLISAKLYVAYRGLRQPSIQAPPPGSQLVAAPLDTQPAPRPPAVPIATVPVSQPIPAAVVDTSHANGHVHPFVAAPREREADNADNADMDFDPFGVGR